MSSRSTVVFVSCLVLFAGVGAWQVVTGGFTDEALARVQPGSDAVVGLVSEGEDVDLARHARPSGRTVFFFTKPWCAACWRLAPDVERAVRAAGDASLRVVDIGSWESDVARRYSVDATPHLVLYEDGAHVVAGIDAVLSRLAR